MLKKQSQDFHHSAQVQEVYIFRNYIDVLLIICILNNHKIFIQLCMIESLPQLQRINLSIEQLDRQKSTLEELKRKSNNFKGKLQKQLSYSIQDRINEAKKKLALCDKLQKDIQNEEFVNAEFLVQDLVFDIKQLPEWFSFVFQKQFDKQRNSFSALAKKLYKQHCLHDKKIELQTQISTFQTLNSRYKSLTQSDINCININSQAQTFQNRCKNIIDRFNNFIELMGKKIMHFVEQNVQKSLSYCEKVGNFGANSDGYGIFSENNKRETEKYSRECRSVNKDKYNSTIPPNTLVTDLNQRSSSSNKCMNHNYHHYNMNHQVNGLCPTHMYGYNYGKGKQVYRQNMCNNISKMQGVGYGESRFNYRDHMPRWASRTLSNFYY